MAAPSPAAGAKVKARARARVAPNLNRLLLPLKNLRSAAAKLPPMSIPPLNSRLLARLRRRAGRPGVPRVGPAVRRACVVARRLNRWHAHRNRLIDGTRIFEGASKFNRERTMHSFEFSI